MQRDLQYKPFVIGISGASGSGKTVLASQILEEIGSDDVSIICEDSYYKDFSNLGDKRAEVNYDHPDSFNHDLLVDHLKRIIQLRESVRIPIYDYRNHCPSAESRIVNPTKVILLEGILLLADEKLRELMDIKIFMDTDFDLCLLRRVLRDTRERQRDLEFVIHQYIDKVRVMYNKFIEPSRQYADIHVPGGGYNNVALDMLKTKIRAVINEGTQSN